MEYSPDTRTDEAVGGLWPPIFNIAPKAVLYANATCGQSMREEFCHTIDAHPQRRQRKTKCGICDANNTERRHPIENVIDGSAKWWQSPTLASGNQYEFVTITLDLKQVSDLVFFYFFIFINENILHFFFRNQISISVASISLSFSDYMLLSIFIAPNQNIYIKFWLQLSSNSHWECLSISTFHFIQFRSSLGHRDAMPSENFNLKLCYFFVVVMWTRVARMQ